MNPRLQRLVERRRFGVKPGLERIERALEKLAQPHLDFGAIHIAGTNGKGSTAAMVAHALTACGYKTGLFTSPHLTRFNERIKIDGQEISDVQLELHLDQILNAHDGLTFFEAATAVAFLHFSQQKIDVGVFEVGLGGRYDATNILKPDLCAITRIGLDHQEILGESIAEIAFEKAGIVKEGVPTICACSDPAALEVIEKVCCEKNAPLQIAGRDFKIFSLGSYSGPSWEVESLELGIAGEFQRENAAVSLAALEAMQSNLAMIDANVVVRSLKTVSWPGRFERIGMTIFDCAHNVSACETLAGELSSKTGLGLSLFFATTTDRPGAKMLEILSPFVKTLNLVEVGHPRMISAQRLAEIVGGPSQVVSLAQAGQTIRTTKEPCLVTGSTFLVGPLRAQLLNMQQDSCELDDPM